ncbi:MAG: AbrB/MazE/SpoVT family DNA-binding domain-containing protein [Candidatus Thiodiazotropha sp. (ex Dulcina madagascariensis)]|nr:AbrB/MazE/SpoVT family DNA-binding domain-containing protein [Candidatus Thiodiazotropha sp. (ex Dulcina madagascariensis)]
MPTTHLSSKGRVVIPKAVRESQHWQPGQTLDVIETPDGILLRNRTAFTPATLKEVAGSLSYEGPARSLDEMEQAIAEGVGNHEDCA